MSRRPVPRIAVRTGAAFAVVLPFLDATVLPRRAGLGIMGCPGFAAAAAALLGVGLLRSVPEPISFLSRKEPEGGTA